MSDKYITISSNTTGKWAELSYAFIETAETISSYTPTYITFNEYCHDYDIDWVIDWGCKVKPKCLFEKEGVK